MVSDGVSSCNLPLASWHHSWKISSLFSQVSRGRASAETSFVSWGDKKTFKHLAWSYFFWVLGAVVPAESSRLSCRNPSNYQLAAIWVPSSIKLRLSVTFLHNTAWIVLTVSGCWGVGVGRTPCSSQIFSAIKFAWQTISHASSNVRRYIHAWGYLMWWGIMPEGIWDNSSKLWEMRVFWMYYSLDLLMPENEGRSKSHRKSSQCLMWVLADFHLRGLGR